MAVLPALLLIAASAPGPLPDPVASGAPCPVIRHRPRGAGEEICFGEAGPNYAFAFVYPAEAARVPALEARLREDRDIVRAGFEEIIGFARDYPQDHFAYEEAWTLDASTAELIALSGEVWEQAGAAPRRTGRMVAVWDRAAGTPMAPEGLFTDADALNAEIRRLACPALARIREGRFDGECARPGYDVRPVGGTGGRIDRLLVLFDDLDEDGGDAFRVTIPVTPALIGFVQPRFRAGFAESRTPATACNPALPAHPCPGN